MPYVLADSGSPIPGVDLNEYYVIVGDPGQIYSVTYNKKSQSNMRPQTYDADGLRCYLIPKSEEPTTLSIQPVSASSSGVAYGIKSMTDSNGKSYSSMPRFTSISMSELTPGVPVNVETTELDNIITGRLTITVKDDASRVGVYFNTGYYSISYLPKDFTGNTLEIKYDSKTETKWSIYHTSGEKLFMTKLDGVRQERSYVASPPVNGTMSMLYDFYVKLGSDKTEHKVDVMADVIECDVPMTFECVQTTGNETDPERLSDMIASVTVAGGNKYTNKEWAKEGFTVPNGKLVFVTIKPQSYGIWEVGEAYFNGHKLSSSGTYMEIEVDSPSEVQTYRLSGKLNNPWHYTLKFNDPTRTKVIWSGSELDIPSGATTYNGTGGISAPALKPMGRNSETEENPVIVTEVEVDGKKIPLDSDGSYTPKKMDEVITISTTPYKREIPIQVFLNPMGYDDYYIILNSRGQARKFVSLKEGWQTVMVNPQDMPFVCRSSYPAVYLNGSTNALPLDNGYVQGLDNVSSGTRIKIYPSTPNWRGVTTKIESGLSCTIAADGEQVEAGYKSYPQGTVLKFIPDTENRLDSGRSEWSDNATGFRRIIHRNGRQSQ